MTTRRRTYKALLFFASSPFLGALRVQKCFARSQAVLRLPQFSGSRLSQAAAAGPKRPKRNLGQRLWPAERN